MKDDRQIRLFVSRLFVSKIVYNKDLLKSTFPDITDNIESYKAAIHEDIKNKINQQMPAYKYIRHIIITDVPLIKTTTQKIKRNEEICCCNTALMLWDFLRTSNRYERNRRT